jgi:tetratricopeptide (TPR) repeat protein
MRVIARTAAVLATATFCGWALLLWAYTPHACNVAITKLTQRTTLVVGPSRIYERETRARQNIEALRVLGERCRTDVHLPMLIAANQEALSRYEDAVRSYRAALLIDRRPEIHKALADALIQLGRTDEAVEHYVIAARFNPETLENGSSEEVVRRARERLRASP